MPSITNLVTTVAPNTKTNKLKSKVANITNLASTSSLTAAEKNPNVRNLVKKADYNTKINEIENKTVTDHDHGTYITTQDFHKLTAENVTARLAQANLASINDIVYFVKNTVFVNKLKKTK